MVYIRRFIWFVARWLIGMTVAIGILICAFYMCLNTSNIYIVVKDGMETRVDVILTRENAENLNNYFHPNFLGADPALGGAFNGTSAYSDYAISGYDYDLSIESLWAWPWNVYATCTVVERVGSITGKVSSKNSEVSSKIPPWQGGRYELTLGRSDGKWKIMGMKQTATVLEAE